MSATARRGWRVPVVAFITGVFIATAVLTRDYTVGDDVLAALVAGEISSINAQASDFSSLPTPRARVWTRERGLGRWSCGPRRERRSRRRN